VIKAIITDIDGVIVGKRLGVNFPLPNKKIISALSALHKNGIPVVICTAKFNHAVKDIILDAQLRNPHITDGGALIIDPLEDKIIQKHIFTKDLARNIVEKCIEGGIYTEVYGAQDYYLQVDHKGDFTEKRIRILQKEQKTVTSLVEQVEKIEVIKIINFAHNDYDREKITTILLPFKNEIHYVWSQHPTTVPSTNTIITIKGVSKKSASREVLEYLNISPSEVIGVGDTMGDWNFMSLCTYVGVVGDESPELKELAKTKGEGNYFFGSSVDDDGFLQILNYFGLSSKMR
jgi:HAD superfamily hydrolase (TIGR01484 family)